LETSKNLSFVRFERLAERWTKREEGPRIVAALHGLDRLRHRLVHSAKMVGRKGDDHVRHLFGLRPRLEFSVDGLAE